MKIYWDYLGHALMTNIVTNQSLDLLQWVLRDQVPVSLYLVEDDGSGTFATVALPAGYSIKFAIKLESALSGDSLAFAGTWTDGGSNLNQATVDLATAELLAAMDAETEVDFLAEFVLQDESGNHRDSTQIACRIHADVYRGTEPESSAAVTTRGRWKNGEYQVKNVTTGLYHSWWLDGSSGAGELRFGEGEE